MIIPTTRIEGGGGALGTVYSRRGQTINVVISRLFLLSFLVLVCFCRCHRCCFAEIGTERNEVHEARAALAVRAARATHFFS